MIHRIPNIVGRRQEPSVRRSHILPACLAWGLVVLIFHSTITAQPPAAPAQPPGKAAPAPGKAGGVAPNPAAKQPNPAPAVANAKAAAPAAAQFAEFRPSDPNAKPEVRKDRKSKKDAALRGPGFNQADVQSYYMNYILPDMTILTNLERNEEARRELLADIDLAERAGDAVYTPYAAMLVAMCNALATKNYHPTAAINAIHVLGRLNKTRPRPNSLPEPHPGATQILLGLCINGNNDGIRAAAMAQFERHVDLGSPGWNKAAADRVAQMLLDSIKQPRPARRTARADAWIKGRLMEILCKFSHSKEQDLYQLALSSLADKQSDPMLIEKALLVTGSYPANDIFKSETTKPSLANAVAFSRARVLDWQQHIRTRYIPLAKAPIANAPADGGGGEEEMVEEAESVEVVEEFVEDPSKKGKKRTPPNYAKQSVDLKQNRRALHEILEILRFGFTGVRYGEPPVTYEKGLASLIADPEQTQLLNDVLGTFKELQEVLNKQTLVDRGSLDAETAQIIDRFIKDVDDLLAVLSSEAADAAINATPELGAAAGT